MTLPRTDAPIRALLVTDLDGTLIELDGALPSRNLEAILRARERGMLVAIATGRRRSTFRRERDRLAPAAFRTSCSNGAVLLAEDNERVESFRAISWQGMEHLATLGATGGHHVVAITIPRDATEPGEEADAWVLAQGGGVFSARSPWDPATHVARTLEEAQSRALVHAALLLPSREEAERLEPAAREVFGAGHAVHVVRSPRGEGALLEIGVAGGKGAAVADLALALGLPHDAVAAIGDDMNDAAMFDIATHRYAVGGSVLAARRPDATEVCVASGGAVADALSRFLAEIG